MQRCMRAPLFRCMMCTAVPPRDYGVHHLPRCSIATQPPKKKKKPTAARCLTHGVTHGAPIQRAGGQSPANIAHAVLNRSSRQLMSRSLAGSPRGLRLRDLAAMAESRAPQPNPQVPFSAPRLCLVDFFRDFKNWGLFRNRGLN